MTFGGRKTNLALPGWRAAVFIFGFAAAFPLHASITYTCGGGVNQDGTTMASLCGSINTLMNSSQIYGQFSNVNASILIDFGSTGLGESNAAYSAYTYSAWRNALVADATSANDFTSVGAGGSVTPTAPSFATNIELTNAEVRALMLGSPTMGISSIDGTACTLGDPNCFDGVIIITTNAALNYRSGPNNPNYYDFYSTVEHETDEVLGTVSSLSYTYSGGTAHAPAIDQFGTGNVTAPDIFRYAAAGLRSYDVGCGVGNQGCGSPYFSIDGGQTDVDNYYNLPYGPDFGDWYGGCPGSPHVQDAYACPGASPDIAPNVEGEVLDVLGYNNSTPEPATWATLLGGFAAMILVARRRKINRSEA